MARCCNGGPSIIQTYDLAVAEMWLLVRDLDQIAVGAITRDGNDAVLTCGVVWPDDTPGTFTADTVSVDFPGAVDAWHVTYDSPTPITVTQPLVTRNVGGAIIDYPAIEVT